MAERKSQIMGIATLPCLECGDLVSAYMEMNYDPATKTAAGGYDSTTKIECHKCGYEDEIYSEYGREEKIK